MGSIPAEDMERVQALVNQWSERGRYNRPQRTEPTTDAVVLVSKSPRSGRPYHAYVDENETACPYDSEAGFQRWDREEAEEWFTPCKVCFPDAADGDR